MTLDHCPAKSGEALQGVRRYKEAGGIDRTPNTLKKLATTGGGPQYRKAGRFPVYDEPALDIDAQSILGPQRSSTSQAA